MPWSWRNSARPSTSGHSATSLSGTHATSVTGGEHPTVHTQGGAVIRARAVVVATNVPVNDRVVLHTKLEDYRTYVIAAELPRRLDRRD